MIQFAYSFFCGLTGHVFIHILCADGEVFGWWPKLLRKVLFGSTAIRQFEDMKWWELAIYKPLAGCGVCNSGWWAMAYYFFNEHFSFSISERYAFLYGTFDFFAFVFFVVTAIFTAWVLEKVRDFVIKHT